ncbi:MAG TPA: zinc ribbon domain-containing protein [Anaerolineae bacterium]|nr:zinc ribbon domain-containing protein [Anaerolineae bacterium]
MAELRCPMCSKVNEPDADVCSFCGARLKPLVIDTPSNGLPPDSHEDAPPVEMTPEDTIRRSVEEKDRLAGMAGDEEEERPPETPPSTARPEWLEEVRPPEPIPPSEEDAGVEPAPEKSPQTDYLERLRRVDRPIFEDESKATPSKDAPAVPAKEEAFKDEFLDWLQGVWEEDEAKESAVKPPVRPAGEAREAKLEAGLPEEGIGDLPPIEIVEEPEPETLPSAQDTLEEGIAALAAFDFAAEPEAEPSPMAREREPEDLSDLAASDIDGEPEADVSQDAVEGEDIERAEVEEDYVPPLVMDQEIPEQEPQDVDIQSIQIPEWVDDVQDITTLRSKGEPDREADISRATIPDWLESLRPIESLRPLEEEETPEPPSVETIGPLAGLQDVLMAEPVVAFPHAPGVSETDISITSQQSEQISILSKLVEEERKQIEPQKVRRAKMPILQWIVGFVMVVAVVIPILIGESIFPSPRWVPHDLETLRNLVETFDSNRPTLVVADYDPGYSAELEAVGSSLLDHLMRRGMPVVTLSTRASGPALAQRLIDHISVWQEVEAGRDYMHLGYLAGGPTAIQLFASNPRREGLRGFMLPDDRDWESPWQSPILDDVQQFPDFGAVVVITAGTETARTWAEQAAPLAGDTPFIMVLSAGAEPLVRPYYAASDAHVDAILTGLPSAKANELLNGHEGDASLLWDSFGIGGWMATCFLIVGGAIGTTFMLLNRNGKDEVHV